MLRLLWKDESRWAPRWGCPEESRLAGFVEDRLEPRARESIAAHLADCAFCAGQVAYLLREREVAEEVPAALLARARELAAARPPAGTAPWRWAAAGLATAGLVLVVALQLRQPMEAPGPTPSPLPPALEAPVPRPSAPSASVPDHPVRSAPQPAAVLRIVAPQEGAVLRAGEREFRWEKVSARLYYDLILVTAEGDLVWQGRTESEHLRLPDRVTLTPGQKYFAWVVAHLPDGRARKSPAIGFQVAGG